MEYNVYEKGVCRLDKQPDLKQDQIQEREQDYQTGNDDQVHQTGGQASTQEQRRREGYGVLKYIGTYIISLLILVFSMYMITQNTENDGHITLWVTLISTVGSQYMPSPIL